MNLWGNFLNALFLALWALFRLGLHLFFLCLYSIGLVNLLAGFFNAEFMPVESSALLFFMCGILAGVEYTFGYQDEENSEANFHLLVGCLVLSILALMGADLIRTMRST